MTPQRTLAGATMAHAPATASGCAMEPTMFKIPPIRPERLPDLLRRMPKAELHIHIE